MAGSARPKRTGGRVPLSGRIADELRFLQTWVTAPHRIGAVSPSSRALARLMVRRAAPDPNGYTLELGPGTGVATQALIDWGVPAERIVAVEHDPRFCRLVSERFPGVRVIEGDALDLATTLAPLGDIRFSAVISGLPLLVFPRERRLACVEAALDRLPPEGRMVQFSYGLASPLGPAPPGIVATKSRWVVMNLPPARAWTYTRPNLNADGARG